MFLLLALSFVPALLVQAATLDGRLNANQRFNLIAKKVDAPNKVTTNHFGAAIPPYKTIYYFDQLIDHDNPDAGTFKQRYWHTWEYYQKGGPIILTTPGEGNAEGYEGYLTNLTINGLIAQQQNGATIVLEHRFFGLSNPYPDLTVKSLRVHTLAQATEDLAYFAKNVKLPMPGGDQVAPGKAPWVLIGGSYAGALTSWTMVSKPGVFWAGYSSSGVVQAIANYWSYFEPVRQNMPQNCSADVQAVIAYADKVLSGDNTTAIQDFKTRFGMEDVQHLDDVAGALRNNLWDWQSLDVSTGPSSRFYTFCDALEVNDIDGAVGPPEGWGLEHALFAWGQYFKNLYLQLICDENQTVNDCLGSYDLTQPYWTNTTIDNSPRSWEWLVCNEVGYLQDSPPDGAPSLVSRLIQPAYDIRQCQQLFPEAFPTPQLPQTDATNAKYQGWNVTVDRIFFANGIRDPWRDATVSADGLQIQSTSTRPIGLGDGFHCSDLGTREGQVDATVAAVQQQALASMKEWLSAWVPTASA